MEEIERTINNELWDMPLYFFSRTLEHDWKDAHRD
jgi:hypothetical protein